MRTGRERAGEHSRVNSRIAHPQIIKSRNQILTLLETTGAGRADGVNFIVPVPGVTCG